MIIRGVIDIGKMEKGKLNVDVPGAISDFEAAAKEFELKEKLYRVIFRGKGLDFDKYRDFASDEDASNIDWKASLRANKLIARQYIEERDLNFVFVVDVSENMLLGSSAKLKCEYAAEIFAALAHLIIISNDRAGLVLYGDKIKNFIPPRGGTNQFFFLADILSDASIYGGAQRFDRVLDFLLDYLPKSIDAVVLISDFIRTDESMLNKLFLVSNKFETVAIMVKDLLDKTFPDVDREIVIEDPATGEQMLINPKKIKGVYERNALEREKIVKSIFKRSNIDLLEIMTHQPFAFSLAGFLGERVKLGRTVV